MSPSFSTKLQIVERSQKEKCPCPMYMRFFTICLLWLLSLLFISRISLAGGPLYIAPSTGVGSEWSSPISLHPENGTCASFSHAEMLEKLSTNLSYWENVEGVNLSFNIDSESILSDVNHDNYNTYYVNSDSDPGLTDGLNPVIFDDDGTITSDIYGTNAEYSVLGFAGPTGLSSDYVTINDGQAVFNCRCLDGNNAGACEISGFAMDFTEEDLDFTMVHEIGHMINLDHTQVNEDLVGVGCDTSVSGDCDTLPAMYPQSVDPADQISPSLDDQVALLDLYGTSGWDSSYCAVFGTIVDVDGEEIRCADVQAQTDDEADTIAIVSGTHATYEDLNGDGYSDGDGECLTDCGKFTLKKLDPNKTYTLKVVPISSKWIGGSSVGPCTNGQPSGVVEETIGTISSVNCVAGHLTDLGTIQTESDVIITEASDSGSDSGSDSSSSSSSCGSSGGDFSSCDALISCSLKPSSTSHQDTWLSLSFIVLVLGYIFFSLKKYKNR